MEYFGYPSVSLPDVYRTFQHLFERSYYMQATYTSKALRSGSHLESHCFDIYGTLPDYPECWF